MPSRGKVMRYYLSRDAALRRLEFSAVYHIANDELYEVDDKAFTFLGECAGEGGCPGSEDADFVAMCISEGILGTERQSRRRAPVLPPPVPSLRYLEIQITNACNLKCKHCYVCQSPRHELTPDKVRALLGEFEEMQGLRLMVTGGEPLVHSRFAEINDLLADYECRKILFTNGMLLTKAVARSLNVHEIQISVDGMQSGHNALRGAGSYEVVMRHAEDALSQGIEVSIATMVHRDNLGEFSQMDELFRRMGIRDWTVDVPSFSGDSAEYPRWWVPPETAGPCLRYGFGAGLHGDGEGHACGLHLAAAMPDGTIARCGFYGDEPLGTIAKGLRSAWLTRNHLQLEDLACASIGCPVLDLCRGGCRFRACHSAGADSVTHHCSGYRGPDPYKCYAYGIIRIKEERTAPHEGAHPVKGETL